MTSSERIGAILRSWRFRHANEADLQRGIATALLEHDIVFARERVLSPGNRIDFLAGDVGVEVKVQGPLAEVLRQLERYAEHAEIGSLVLVTSRLQLARVPAELAGKPLSAVYVGGAFT